MNKIAIIVSLLLVMVVGLGSCTSTSPRIIAPAPPPRAIERPPAPPSNLTADRISHDAITLRWIDNSDNEDGFKIYRDNKLIETAHSNFTTYQDMGLKPGTTYSYMVKAYNTTGESQGCSVSARTLNPPITVRLDRVGVYDNREVWARGRGEVYVGIAVCDGKTTVEQRFPPQEGQHFTLDKNEAVDIGNVVFSVDEVGDYLTVFITGYESDGGALESMFYEALGAAALGYISGGSGTFLEMFEYSLGSLLGTLFGAEDDWLGSFEQTWPSDSNWGVGKYSDIPCWDERGVQCLRLWFTITSP